MLLRRSATVACLTVLLAVAIAASAPAAPPHAPRAKPKPPATVVLTDPVSKLTVRAPRGYRLGARGGVYTLLGGGAKTRFFFGRSALGAKETGAQLAAALGGKAVVAKATPTVYTAAVTKGKVVTAVRLTVKAGVTQVVLVTPVVQRSAGRTARLGPAQVSLADVAALARIVGTRTGGTAVPINTTIPMRRFVAPDGGSSANVIDLPGWQWSGTQGSINGAHPTLGFVALGNIGGVQNGSSPQFAFSPAFVGPADVLANIYPQYAKLISGANVQMTNVQLVAGTQDILGPGSLSGVYQTALTINGRQFVGLFLVSSSDAAGLAPSLWYFYYSAAVLSVDAPASVGAALLDTWASWDASGASAQRLQQTLATIASTRVPGAPIDPVVFQEAADKWGAYIRG